MLKKKAQKCTFELIKNLGSSSFIKIRNKAKCEKLKKVRATKK